MKKLILLPVDAAIWAWCWLACWLVQTLPITRRGSLIDRFTLWLLPWAGFYGFHEPWMDWRYTQRPARPELSAEGPF